MTAKIRAFTAAAVCGAMAAATAAADIDAVRPAPSAATDARTAQATPYASARIRSFDSIPLLLANIGALLDIPEAGMAGMVAAVSARQLIGAAFDTTRPIAAAIALPKPLDFKKAAAARDADSAAALRAGVEAVFFAAAVPIAEENAKTFIIKKGGAEDGWKDAAVRLAGGKNAGDGMFAAYKRGHLVFSNKSVALGAFADKVIDGAAEPFTGSLFEFTVHEPAWSLLADAFESDLFPSDAGLFAARIRADIDGFDASALNKAYMAVIADFAKQVKTHSYAADLTLSGGLTLDSASTLKPGKYLAAASKPGAVSAEMLSFIPDGAEGLIAVAPAVIALYNAEYSGLKGAMMDLAAAVADAEERAVCKRMMQAVFGILETAETQASYLDVDSKGRLVAASKETPGAVAEQYAELYGGAMYFAKKIWAQNMDSTAVFPLSLERGVFSVDVNAFTDAGTDDATKSVVKSLLGGKFIINSKADGGALIETAASEGSDYKFGVSGGADGAARKACAALVPAGAAPVMLAGGSLSRALSGFMALAPDSEVPQITLPNAAPPYSAMAAWRAGDVFRSRFNIPAEELQNLAAFFRAVSESSNKRMMEERIAELNEDGGDDEDCDENKAGEAPSGGAGAANPAAAPTVSNDAAP